MAHLSAFRNDIFISYSHIDNQPFGENEKCWVSEFHRHLETRIENYLGHKAAAWRDLKLGGTDVFSAEIVDQLKSAGVLVSILSPGYLHSEWCNRELREFVEAAEQSGGVRVGNKYRIVKVIKTPIAREKLPQVLDTMLGYEFYHVEANSGRVRELHLHPDREVRLAYWTKVDDVAQEIKTIFGAIAIKPGTALGSQSASIVYLAETTSDLQLERDNLRRELEDRGHQVLPDRPLPWRAADFVEAVRAYLTRSSLSIHLLGAKYGIIPEDETRSIVALQNELAAQHQTEGFSRVLWIPPGLKATEQNQSEFISGLRMHAAERYGFDLVETPLEDLKTIVLDKLQACQTIPQPKEAPAGQLRVYLICDPRDRTDIKPLKDFLERDFIVTLPLSTGDATQIREDHYENLLLCDAVLVYWGRADEFWARAKLRDLARARGLGRSDRFLAQMVYVTMPARPEKTEFDTREADIIRCFEPFSAECLQPFVSPLQGRRKGA